MNARIFSSGWPCSGYRLISAVTRMSHLPSVTDCDPVVARIAEARVKRRRKIRRLVAEVEAAHAIVLVEHVACPELHAPRVPVAADAQIREAIRLRYLIVAVVEEELVHAGEIETRRPSRRRAVNGAQRVRVLRCVRLLAAGERRKQ